MPLRLRSRVLAHPLTKPIGTIDYVDLTHGHKSFLSAPLKVFSTVGTMSDEISFDENHGKPPYNVGGPFFLRRTLYPYNLDGGGVHRSAPGNPPHGASTRPNCGGVWHVEYNGAFACDWNVYGSPPLPGESIKKPTDYDGFSNKDDLSALGNRGYGKLRPKVSKPNVMQDILEMRDVPRTLKSSVKAASDTLKTLSGQRGGWEINPPKKAGEAFLTFQFGWKPTVNGIIEVIDAVNNFEDHVARIKRGNNRWRQRKFAEDDVVSETLHSQWLNQSRNFCTPSMDSWGQWVVPGSGHFRIWRQQVTRVWYEGSFKYYRPEFGHSHEDPLPEGPLNDIRRAATVLGGNLNPTTVYKVMPWTWLFDWFVNASDFVQRMEDLALQGVVSRYLYLMRETIDRFVLNPSWTFMNGGSMNLRFNREVTVKRRVGSNSPFNFTLLPAGGLSDMQWAILAAMGLSHLGG